MSANRPLVSVSPRLGSVLLAIGAALANAAPAPAQIDGSLDPDFGAGGVVIRTDPFEQSWLTDLAATRRTW